MVEPQRGRPTLSLVLPIYNEEEVIPELHRRLQEFLEKLGLSAEVRLRQRRVARPLDGAPARDRARRSRATASSPSRATSATRRPSPRASTTRAARRSSSWTPTCRTRPRSCSRWSTKWREGFDVVYGRRRKREGETLVQARDGARLLPRLRRDDPHRGPPRHGRLPPDEPAGRPRAARAARDAPLRPRDGRVGRLQADRGALRPPGALRRARRSTRSARWSASRSTGSRASASCRSASRPTSAC